MGQCHARVPFALTGPYWAELVPPAEAPSRSGDPWGGAGRAAHLVPPPPVSPLRWHVTTAVVCLAPRVRSSRALQALGTPGRAPTTCSPFFALTLPEETPKLP